MKKLILCLCLFLICGCQSKMEKFRDYILYNANIEFSIHGVDENDLPTQKTYIYNFDVNKELSISVNKKDTLYKIEYIDKSITQNKYIIDDITNNDSLDNDMKLVKESMEEELKTRNITLDELIDFSFWCYEKDKLF